VLQLNALKICTIEDRTYVFRDFFMLKCYQAWSVMGPWWFVSC
jgi:hypothetical protein